MQNCIAPRLIFTDMNSKQEFITMYERFLMSANDSRITPEFAHSEAVRVSEMIDTDDYMTASLSGFCQLCADDSDVRTKNIYGLTDFGNVEPKTERSIKLGGERTGTVLPISIPVCKRCRRNYLLVQNLPTLISVTVIALALLFVNLPSVKQSLYDGNLFVPPVMRPFFVFALVTAITVILCAALRRVLIEKLSAKTLFNILEIKTLPFLSKGGWMRLYGNKHFSQVLFAPQKPAYMQFERHDENCECEEKEADSDLQETSEDSTSDTDDEA
ncbi:MAG: hypothetical protein IJO93_07215 [Clostridia bacterium]|nr:hypothetical protein [Clostridia bacterium]